MSDTDQTPTPSLSALMKEYRPSMSGDVLKSWAADVHTALAADAKKSPSYDALLLIAQSVAGALTRAGVTDCDDPGEAIDVLREKWEREQSAGTVAVWMREGATTVMHNFRFDKPDAGPWVPLYHPAPPADPATTCWQHRPGSPCPTPASCRANGCSAVEREIFPDDPAKASGSAPYLRNLCDAAAKGFHTSESYGPGSMYLHVSKFKTLQDMQDYQRAWTDAMVSVRDATQPASVPEVTEFPKKVTKTVCDGCPNLRTKRWKDHLEDDETDSGTEATCAQVDRHISMYWHEGNATPAWCPLTAAMQEGKSHG